MQENQITSIYARVNGQSLAQQLMEMSSDDIAKFYEDERKIVLGKELDTLLTGYEFKDEQPDVSSAVQIITNAALLERFKIEAIEALSQNNKLEPEEKTKILKGLFGENSNYSKLYNEYYATGSGLVDRAQAAFQGYNIQPLFKDVIPSRFSFEHDFKIDEAGKVFKTIAKMNKDLGDSHHEMHTIRTVKLDEANLEASMMGVIMSDPRQLGATLALMGNKNKEGEINIVHDKKAHVGKNTVKGVGRSAARCLFVLAILGAFIAAGVLLSPIIATALGASVAVTSVISGVVGAAAGFGLSETAIKHIEKRTVEERGYTAVHESSHTDQPVVDLVSKNLVQKYIVAPYLKGRRNDKIADLEQFEKKLNNIDHNVINNRRVIKNITNQNTIDNIATVRKAFEAEKNFFQDLFASKKQALAH